MDLSCAFSFRTPSTNWGRAVWAMALAAVAWNSPGFADTLQVYSFKDNSLIENPAGAVSNGLGEGIYCGRTGSSGGSIRLRAVLAFNLSSIPVGSTINSASLRLVLVQGHGGSQTHTVHRLLADWGEGTSFWFGGTGAPATTNDATWMHRFYPNTFWSTPGGDFVATASASATVGNSGATTWSSAGLIADVQAWVDNPSTNFGWIVRGNEVTLSTAKQFVSHNWANNPDAPLLTINYTPPPPPACTADINHDGSVNVSDLLAVINSWGPCPAPPAACASDVAPSGGDASVNVSDLLAVINAWGACPH